MAIVADQSEPQESLPPLQRENKDYVVWQNKMLEGEEGASHFHFWKDRLDGELPALNLQTDRARPPFPSVRNGLCKFAVPRELSDRFQNMAKKEMGVSPFMLCLSAYHVLLMRYTGQTDICVGAPTAGRDERFAGIFNYYVSPVVMRAGFRGSPTFREFLKENGRDAAQALKHQNYPFPLLVDQLLDSRDSSRSPIFQTQFVWENSNRFENRDIPLVTMLENGNEQWDLWGITLERELLVLTLDQFDLTMKMVKVQDHFYGLIEYNTDLFNPATMDRFAANYTTLLESIVENPDKSVNRLEILPPSERDRLLVSWNDTAADYPREQCVFELIEARVEQMPEAPALVFEGRRFSYRELNAKANQLAHYLQKLGAAPDVLVGVCMKRTPDLVISLVAAHKAGAAYAPLDPA